MKWKCFEKKPSNCSECDREEKAKQKKAQQELQRQLKLQREKEQYEERLRELDEEIRRVAEEELDKQLAQERRDTIEQRNRDLDQARQRVANSQNKTAAVTQANEQAKTESNQNSTSLDASAQVSGANPKVSQPPKPSLSETEWARQKRVENASNDAIDNLMAMTGLEGVKAQFLKIKTKIETAKRQGTNLRQDRFGITMLGNPGTGKEVLVKMTVEVD